MANTNDPHAEPSPERRPTPPEAAPADSAALPPQQAAPTPNPPANAPPAHPWRKRLLWLTAIAIGLAVGGYFLVPWIVTALNTVSTDGAYVNGHVTLVAPRVAGQVSEVLVDDNYRVQRGDVLVRLDREPYQVQLAIREAAVKTAKADLIAAEARFRGQVVLAHANRYKMEQAMEDVRTQIANLHAAVATLHSKEATRKLAENNLERGERLRSSGGISKEDLDQRRQKVKIDKAAVEQSLQEIYALRAGLGLSPKPEKGKELTDVPAELDQNFSAVQSSLATLLQSAAQFGYVPTSFDSIPKKAFADFYELDPSHQLDAIIGKLMPEALAELASEDETEEAD